MIDRPRSISSSVAVNGGATLHAFERIVTLAELIERRRARLSLGGDAA